MKLFAAWVADLDDEFDPAIHCIPAEAFSVSLKQEEGGVEAVTLNRQQLGWAILHPDKPKNVLISESMTGLPEDARLISRARLTSLPNDLFGLTQTLTLAAAPADVEDRLKQWVLDNLADDSDYEPLLSSGDGNTTNDKVEDVQPSEYLENKSAEFYFDPMTHEISTSDIIDDPTGRMINMANAALNAEDISVSVGEGPVTQVTVKATVQWTQEAKGFCNIGTRVGPITTVGGIGFDMKLPEGMVDYVNGYGWELYSNDYRSSMWSSPIFSTKVNIEQKKADFGTYFAGYAKNFNIDGSYTYGEPNYGVGEIARYSTKSLRYDSIDIYQFDYFNTLMKYDFSQPRSEDIYVTLELPAQSAPIVKAVLDLGQLQVSDPTDDPFSDTYEPGVYQKGERVQLGGKVYEAVEDHTSTSITMQRQTSPIVYDHFVPFNDQDAHPYWREVPSQAAMKFRWQASFADTERGKKLLEALLLRCRKKALERLRYMNVTFRFRWQDANTITLRDSLRVLVPFGDGTTRPIVGKVIAIDKQWDGETGALISVTIGVPFGTGLDERPETIPSGYDVVAAGVLDDYPTAVDAYVGGDTRWVFEPGLLRRPIDASRLSDPAYAVMATKKVWLGPAQYSRIQANAWSGREPKAPTTQVQVSMRPLISEGNINRDYDVYGTMTWSPRGIDLVQGGEP